jgi:iron complex outermembrane receptor protein
MICENSGASRLRPGKRALVATILGATALTAPIAAAPALAQEGQSAGADRNVIIVTAQRRSSALEDVPMSVSVISQEKLDAVGVDTIRDLANVTSGFQVNNSGTYTQPAIRGVTTTNSGSYENNVALFVDGLYQITPQVLNMELPNVQSIQILKGPQGTLYGRNATGGAILIETVDPGEEWEGNAELTYGRFDDKRARAYVAGPLSDRVGISLAGTIRKTDGYYKRASVSQPLTETDGRGLGLEQ